MKSKGNPDLFEKLLSGASLIATLVLVLGCRKPAMSSTDTIRTGNGDSMRYMVPIAVKQDDGSSAYCVYVARPNADMNFFENLGPGRTEGATPVTKNAIPQGQFIQNLRDPEIMKDLGGLGNDMVNDLFTAGSAWMLASAGLGVGAGVGFAARNLDPRVAQYKDESQKLLARFLEADSIVSGELKLAYDELGKMLLTRGAPRKSVDLFKRLLASGAPSARNEEYYNSFFQKFGDPGKSNDALLNELQDLLLGANSKNARISNGEAVKFHDAIVKLHNRGANRELILLTNRLTRFEGTVKGLLGGVQQLRLGAEGLAAAIKKNPNSIEKALTAANNDLRHWSTNLRDGFAGPLDSALYQGRRSAGRLSEIAAGAAKSIGRASNGASYAAQKAAGVDGLFTRKPSVEPASAWNRLGAIMPEDQRGVAVAANVDEAAETVAAKGGKNLFVDACMRGPGVQRFFKMAACGLVLGVGSLGVKKLLFEPATEPVKREQVAQSFEFNETVQDVNDTTFRRLEETIAAFKSEPTALSCQ